MALNLKVMKRMYRVTSHAGKDLIELNDKKLLDRNMGFVLPQVSTVGLADAARLCGVDLKARDVEAATLFEDWRDHPEGSLVLVVDRVTAFIIDSKYDGARVGRPTVPPKGNK